ncbi:4-alpha-glucanotransferase [Treponema sp. JC4]|uniref:4-alpha-glucanotransferase n=1 Tax=Treponema sp. JC4 TaxID=1124982 RepID=UPI0005870ED8|nr:4-alpha-glucanotransferase [Treponema sp. JC4]
MSILDNRASGVLMHISSLPGNTGIGTLGKYAYQFVDYLKKYGQTYWQMLPICPTSYGDSPYQSFSTFAGNPYFIDFEKLEAEGLLAHDDWANVNWGNNKNYVDYGLLYVERHKVFAKLQENFNKNIPADFEKYCSDNSFWLEDYALFMAIKDAHNGASFSTWESDIKVRQPGAVVNWSERCAKRVQYYKILQYLFYKQWYELKKYANDNGIKIIGDIPIYVAADSSDVWTNPKQFALKGDLTPIEVAGCPPDAFSADGQLWGNPVYDWEYHKQTNYAWWKKRISECLKIYDVIRIDHFRGFDEYYCIPFGSENAKIGQWRKGPGAHLFNEIRKEFGDINIIAEDLGFLTPTVIQMLKDVGFPGMKVLQFAFDSREESDYIPHRYGHNSVVYTGTHDNDTILGWCKSAGADDVAFAKKYLRAESDDELRQEMMISALSCVANTCILCMQDLIGLDGSARMNIPSTVGNNWKWRASEDQITDKQFEFLGYYTRLFGRADR